MINSSTDPLRWGSGEDGTVTWPLAEEAGANFSQYTHQPGRTITRAGTYQFKNLTIEDNTLINIGSVGEFKNGITIFATGKVTIGQGVIFNAQRNTNKFRDAHNYRFAGADTAASGRFTGGGGGGGEGTNRCGYAGHGGNFPSIYYTTGNGSGRGGTGTGNLFKTPMFYPHFPHQGDYPGRAAATTPSAVQCNGRAHWLDTQNSYVHGQYSAYVLKNKWNYTGKGNYDEYVVVDEGTSAEADDNLITKDGHALTLNQTIRFTTLTGGVGLSTSILYYVRPVDSSTFAVSLTPGGDDVAVDADYSVANYTGERDDYPITAGGDGGGGGPAMHSGGRGRADVLHKQGGAGGTGGGMITIIAPEIEFGVDCLLYARGASREPTAKGNGNAAGRYAHSPSESGFGGSYMGGITSTGGMNAARGGHGGGAGAGGGGGGGLVVLVYTRLKGGDPTIRVYRGRGGTTANSGNRGGVGGFGADGYFLMGKRNRDRGPITWEKEGGAGIKDNRRIATSWRGSEGWDSSSGFVERYYDF